MSAKAFHVLSAGAGSLPATSLPFRNSELTELLSCDLERLGGLGSCTTPPCHAHDTLGLPLAGLRHPSAVPSCHGCSRRLMHVLSASMLWTATSSWGSCPRPSPRLRPLWGHFVRRGAGGEVGEQASPPSDLLPALFSPSLAPSSRTRL